MSDVQPDFVLHQTIADDVERMAEKLDAKLSMCPNDTCDMSCHVSILALAKWNIVHRICPKTRNIRLDLQTRVNLRSPALALPDPDPAERPSMIQQASLG